MVVKSFVVISQTRLKSVISECSAVNVFLWVTVADYVYNNDVFKPV